jgi:hypothetical protein
MKAPLSLHGITARTVDCLCRCLNILECAKMAERACLCMQVSNMLAAIVLCGSTEGDLQACTALLKQAGIAPAASFEVAYNLACAATSSGQVSSAQQFLTTAAKVGKETLAAESANQEVRSKPFALLTDVINFFLAAALPQ